MADASYMPTKISIEDEMGGVRMAGKEGHKCCGCCCDTRRAVITVNAIMCTMILLGTIFLFAGIELMEAAAADADDDEVKEAGEQLQQIPLGLLVVVNLVLVALFAAGIKGAVDYNPRLVKCAAFAYVGKFILDLFGGNIAAAVTDAFFAYPHFFFLKEMSENVMTPENYPNEAHCCC
eukprot:CAMPEP_0117028252 /NCGR_PEP_ID=MMETSP0472-20121206/20559_1 /TAXON_ID=693140 ORGANISM="Tiarina fusus, Strain LIS" /NCGR_SAMPLE_ID=MMETSP0472 /ASSEMBLY_ACC=CAM_ASM_000603 /LENGTH=177 /DNA_ID=CAMNT_0004735689 /DNA_START=50 /DNA_END=583 /DNA_ORIENTATION=+